MAGLPGVIKNSLPDAVTLLHTNNLERFTFRIVGAQPVKLTAVIPIGVGVGIANGISDTGSISRLQTFWNVLPSVPLFTSNVYGPGVSGVCKFIITYGTEFAPIEQSETIPVKT